MERSGVINIYKEAGYTSHDVVAKLRGILKQKKIGHTGTLDPQAQGVLPVCLGKGTKLCDLLADHDKEYEAVLRLGITTDTQDMEGTILKESSVQVSEEEVRTCILSFQGEQQQVPPMYSALKVNGKKLYELARQGITVEREARKAVIDDLQIHHLHDDMYSLQATVSSGTYIRTLIQDFAESLGEYAVMTSLIRTGIEDIMLEEAVEIDALGGEKGLVSPMRILNPSWKILETDQVADIQNGKRIVLDTPEC